MLTTNIEVRPLNDRIIVRRMPEETKTKGGIFIPDSAKEKPIQGEVIATGKGRMNSDGKTIPLEVQKGDKVLFNKYSGTEFKFKGEELLMMKEDDVLGIF